MHAVISWIVLSRVTFSSNLQCCIYAMSQSSSKIFVVSQRENPKKKQGPDTVESHSLSFIEWLNINTICIIFDCIIKLVLVNKSEGRFGDLAPTGQKTAVFHCLFCFVLILYSIDAGWQRSCHPVASGHSHGHGHGHSGSLNSLWFSELSLSLTVFDCL